MLYLHCGWQRTSTTSFQAALFRHRRELAETGLVFPRKWLSRQAPTHHGLSEVLRDLQRSPGALDELRSFLDHHREENVVFSAESLTTWLVSPRREETLLRFLAAIAETTPTRCVWTLRRLDEAVASLYLLRLARGDDLLPPVEHLDRIGDPSQFFRAMRRAAEAVGGDAVHVRYDRSGSHNGELLAALDVPGPLRAEILPELHAGVRLNASLSHKQAVTLTHLDEVARRAGAELDRMALRKTFKRGSFAFDDDRRCDLVGVGPRRALHERALAAARGQRFAPYVDFFASDEVRGPASVDLDPDCLTDADLERLASRFARPRAAGAEVR